MSLKAHILTIGTEITSGEVVNSNAAWIATRLEDAGVRVLSHLSVRDQKDELRAALHTVFESNSKFLIVTGGLGPTSDDITREMVAELLKTSLEFDEFVWRRLERLYQKRGLPLREAHRHQCWFPKGSERLKNPVGTALGFYIKYNQMHIFVLPGPPREIEGIWREEIAPRLQQMIPTSTAFWHRWTFFAIPESEVADVVEKIIAGSGLEVGYRAQVPYVRVKLFVDPKQHESIVREMDRCLASSLVGRDAADLAEMLLSNWNADTLVVRDDVSEAALAERLFQARRRLIEANKTSPKIRIANHATGEVVHLSLLSANAGMEFRVDVKSKNVTFSETRALPYKMPLDSERGRRSAAEWALWLSTCVVAKGLTTKI